MTCQEIVKKLDQKSDDERFRIIQEWLDRNDAPYSIQKYETGSNIIVRFGNGRKALGISSHFDVFPGSGGSNDNASAIAVCLEITRRILVTRERLLPITIFFFDEEETGLRGSRAYVKEHGIQDLTGLINMEMVGIGDQLALWPTDLEADTFLLRAFETSAKLLQVPTHRFGQIVPNIADHLSFQNAGLLEAFSITAISDADLQVASHYNKAKTFDVDDITLLEILQTAPIFQHYHQSTDTAEKLNDKSMLMTADCIWRTIQLLSDNDHY